MTVGNYSVRSIGNYVRELRFIFEYYPDVNAADITAEQVEQYICYIKKSFNSGFSKCRLVASSVSFYYKQILKRPYDLPSKLYPRKPFQLPNVMTADEVRQLLSTSINLKQQAILQLFYSSGMRLEECSRLKIADIDSKNMRIKVVQGKGNKDRYTLLSSFVLTTLREYFRKHRPAIYLFEGKQKGKLMHTRSIEFYVEQAMMQERNRIEKHLYPNIIVRMLRRIILPVKQEQVAKQAEQQTANNEQALKESVLKAGFDDISNKLEQNIKQGEREFSIPVSYYVNEKEKLDFNLFFAKDNNGKYQFESYKATLQSEHKSQGNTEQRFVFEPDSIVTATHAYNLLAGRSIQKQFVSGENNKQTAWIQLDFNDKDALGNYKIKEFKSAYGYDVKEVIQQLPLKELSTAEATEKLLNTLINGHRQVVTMQKDGNEQKLFIEANPQFKSVNVYDENLKKISIASVLGNKTSEPLQSNQKISMEQKVEQRKKNGLSL